MASIVEMTLNVPVNLPADVTISLVSRYRVLVTLKPALLDSAGRAVNDALHSLGFEDVEDVRIGKLVELRMKDGDLGKVEEMCKKLLANPVIEDFEIEEG
jgi:phosphoribosylformylglycinamidine synthase PurS subunit